MRKTWKLMLALLAIFGMIAAACGSDDDDSSSGSSSDSSSTVSYTHLTLPTNREV